jgi:8-amino-7-oxononanoate synthase
MAPSSSSLVELFQKQAELLRAHAEIIAEQNRLLGAPGGRALEVPPPAVSAVSAVGAAASGKKGRTSEAPAGRAAAAPAHAPALARSAPTGAEPPPGEPPAPVHPAAPAVETVAPAQTLAGAGATAPSSGAPSTAVRDAVRERVFETVARISAFPRDTLRENQRLVDELGFDSLMVADLSGALADAFPELGVLPASLFSLRTTVGELADHAERRLADRPGGATQDARTPTAAQKSPTRAAIATAPAPARRYRVSARTLDPATRLGPSHDVRGETWLVTGDLDGAIGAALARRGAKVLAIRFGSDAAQGPLSVGRPNRWPSGGARELIPALAAGGFELGGFIHAAGLDPDGASAIERVALLHALAPGLHAPRVAVLSALGGQLGLVPSPALAANLDHAALIGYTQALARERPDAVVRAIDLDPGEPLDAEAILDELLSADATLEIGLARGVRSVAELVPVTDEPRGAPVRPDDVVLISGGAGDLGARVAERLAAARPKAVVLLGRRPKDGAIEQLLRRLDALGTRSTYLSADVGDAVALRAALAGLPAPVTVAVHAAGAIEDARIEQKSEESLLRVLGSKIRGAENLLAAAPGLRTLVLFGSWAGRFGNVGQADYSAGNAWLERLAPAMAGGKTRVLAIDWPPWSASRMARSIPDAFKAALIEEGVCFLDDGEGLEVLVRAMAGEASGIELVARTAPGAESRVRYEEVLSPGKMPFLDDHRLRGRPVLPLASAADLVLFAATGAEPLPVGRAAVIEGLELVRGAFGGDALSVRAERRTEADGGLEARVEIRARGTESHGAGPNGAGANGAGANGAGANGNGHRKQADALAYRARVRLVALGAATAPRPLELAGPDEPPPIELTTFYAQHTFHGPRLRGVLAIRRFSDAGISGLVKRSRPSDWIPGSERSGWALDPLVVDASFQLAGYWAFAKKRKAGFPIGFDRFTILAPFPDAPIVATVVLEKSTEDGFSGQIRYQAEDGRLLAVLENVRGRFEAVAEAPAEVDVPRESFDIALFPEVESLDQRIQMAELVGLRNPYFHVHAGTARNTSVVDGVEMLNFSSYNYLGFSGHPEVVEAAQQAIARYGTSVSASRVASGERPVHRDLEQGIARHIGVDDAIVYVSGHATNVTTIGHLFDRNDLILHDALAHDSILQGVYLSGATRRPFPHGDLEALERTLSQARKNFRRVLICAEGIYSMDGDTCDLPRLIEIKKRYKALLLIDEAHSIGVLGPSGRGIGHHFPGVEPRDVDLWMGTLSKSFASCGGYIAGSSALVRFLKYTAPGFVYSAGITPPNAAAALKALELMNRHPEVVERLVRNSRTFLEQARARGIDTGLAIGAAVIPAIVGNSLECMKLSEGLAKRRINVQPIVYPAVEDNAARLRFFISSTHTEEQLAHTAGVLAEELAAVRRQTASEANGATASL